MVRSILSIRLVCDPCIPTTRYDAANLRQIVFKQAERDDNTQLTISTFGGLGW